MIGDIETGAFEQESGSAGNLAPDLALADRTCYHRRFAYRLKRLELVATAFAPVFIRRHLAFRPLLQT